MRATVILLTLSVIFGVIRSKPVVPDSDESDATISGGAVQRSCDVGGKIFEHGGQIEMSESPCKACLCQDGTVECDTIKCEWRRDCTPKHEPGVCCPKFVDCAGDNNDATIAPMSEKYLAEEHEMLLPVVQLEHLDLISTLSANPAASTTTVEEFTKDSAAVTESSVEAPSEAVDLQGYEARTEEPPAFEGREEFDEANSATTSPPEKLREGDWDLTTLTPMESREVEEIRFEVTEQPEERAELIEVTEAPEEKTLADLQEAQTEGYSSAPLRDEYEPTEAPEDSAELRVDDEVETQTTETPETAELRSSDDEEVPPTSTENSYSTTTTFEGLSTTEVDQTTRFSPTVPDVIVGRIMESEANKVTELNAEVLVQGPLTTTAEPPLVESVETVSVADAEGNVGAAQLRRANASSELKIVQLLYSKEPSSTSRSASDLLLLPQMPRPLAAPAAATASEWKAAAFEETKEELMAGLWHEALDILTGGRNTATARKTHNSKFINRE